jgi:hypothetical protein
MRVVILQPSYIPWRGFFDLIRQADVFVFYDDVQYDKHGWRNRNRIKTAAGTKWLTIPVLAKGNVTESVELRDARIAWTQDWSRKHLETLRQSYAKAPFFSTYFPLLQALYANKPTLLVDLTIPLTIEIARWLGLGPRFVRSSELGIGGTKTGRLVDIVRHVGGTKYLSGPSAKDYLDESAFSNAGIELQYARYAYPEYEQLHPPFDPAVSILDLLFMTGPRARELLVSAPIGEVR